MVGVVAMTVSCLPGRLDYLRDTLDSWRNVRGLKDWLFRFHVEFGGDLSRSNVKVINDWATEMDLNTVHVVQNSSRLGVLRNPWSAFSSAFGLGASFVVLVEEDVLVSNDVLEYMTKTSLEYSDNPNVLAVCAASFGPVGDPEATYLAQDFCPLIWGTWADRWRDILRDSWDHDYSTGNADGSQAGWDWNIRKRILPQRDMVCVFPLVSRSLHIGRFGAHMRPEEFAASQSPSFVADPLGIRCD
jgi:hypothetical protein